MLHTLPSPGTPHFVTLTSELQPFEVSPRGITFEAPSARMADIALNFELLRGAVRLRINYEGFEVVVAELQEEHLAEISKLARIARQTVQDCSPEGATGRCEITCSAHLALEPGKAASILAEHLPLEARDQELTPDAFGYKIQPPNRPEVVEMRLFIAQSVLLKEALWGQFSAVYEGGPPVEELPQQAVDDALEALARLGLRNPQGETG